MKKFITILAGVVLVASLATAAYAQAAGPNGGGVQNGGQKQGQKDGQKGKGAHLPLGGKMLKELNLTPDQQKQVKELLAKFKEKREQEQKGATKPNRKEAMEMRKQFLEDLGKILTPEQKEKMKKLMEEARNKKGGKLGGGAAGGGTGTTKTGGGGL
jgi:Spy/CpxP family protein refolding chaperone